MKRAVILLLLVALLRVEHTAVDITELEPVALLRVTVEAGQVRFATDTGASGAGTDLTAALYALQEQSAARVFPDTADYLVLNAAAQSLLPQLAQQLRPSCRVCVMEEAGDLTELAQYLKIHPPEQKLLLWLS